MESIDTFLAQQATAAKAAMRRCTAAMGSDVSAVLRLPFLARHPSLGLLAVTAGGFLLGNKRLRRRAVALMTAAPVLKGVRGALELLGTMGVGAVRHFGDHHAHRTSGNGAARS
jgi:hypothetical protein